MYLRHANSLHTNLDQSDAFPSSLSFIQVHRRGGRQKG